MRRHSSVLARRCAMCRQCWSRRRCAGPTARRAAERRGAGVRWRGEAARAGPAAADRARPHRLRGARHRAVDPREPSGPRMEVWARLPIFYFSNPLRIFGPDEEVPFPARHPTTGLRVRAGGSIVLREGSNVLEADADGTSRASRSSTTGVVATCRRTRASSASGQPKARTRPRRWSLDCDSRRDGAVLSRRIASRALHGEGERRRLDGTAMPGTCTTRSAR